MKTYKEIAKEARKTVLRLIYEAQTSHISSNFSAIDIMTVLFEKADPKKDEVILSKGWAAAAWYYFLWRKGIITEDELNSYCKEEKCFNCSGVGKNDEYKMICCVCGGTGKLQSKFIGLVEPQKCKICDKAGNEKCKECNGSGKRWGLKVGTGSMGMGLCFAVGFALSKKMKREKGKVYVLMSDGELQCGTTWESALIAAHHKLDNLIVIIDNNGFQAMGKVNKILDLGELDSKFSYFGFENFVINGHDFKQINAVLSDDYFKELAKVKDTNLPRKYPFGKIQDSRGISMNWPKVPIAIIAKTIKGKGVSFMENNNLYHYKNLSEEEYNEALKELNT